MAESKRLAAHRARMSAGTDEQSDETDETITPNTPDKPKGKPDPQPDPHKEDEEVTDETPVEKTEAFAAGQKAANDRMNAVFASEHFAGREAHAAKLLSKGLSAEDTIDLLADMPKAKPVDQTEANAKAEEAAREEMREQMNKNGNVDLGADRGADKEGKTGRAKADARWDKANAAAGRVTKEG